MGAFFRYLMLSFIPLWGISQGYQPFAGTNFGARKFERVKKGTFLFYGFGLLLSLIFWLVFLLMPEQVLGLFLENKELISLGRTNAMLALSLFPLSAIMIINLTLFQALGKAKYAGILVISRQFLLYVPAVLILPIFLGTRGIWISSPLVDTLIMILSVFIMIKLFKTELRTEDKLTSTS